jgi:hypothetical protein
MSFCSSTSPLLACRPIHWNWALRTSFKGSSGGLWTIWDPFEVPQEVNQAIVHLKLKIDMFLYQVNVSRWINPTGHLTQDFQDLWLLYCIYCAYRDKHPQTWILLALLLVVDHFMSFSRVLLKGNGVWISCAIGGSLSIHDDWCVDCRTCVFKTRKV